MVRLVIDTIRAHSFSCFSDAGPEGDKSIFRTRAGTSVFDRVFTCVGRHFSFSSTSSLLRTLGISTDEDEISERQKIFSIDASGRFLRKIAPPKPTWKPRYSSIVATEDERSFTELRKKDIPAMLLTSPHDVESLDSYDVVQVIDTEAFTHALEALPQTVFLSSVDDAYMERHLSLLSGWAQNLRILSEEKASFAPVGGEEEVSAICDSLLPLIGLLSVSSKKISRQEAEEALVRMNKAIEVRMKDINIPGERLYSLLAQNSLPEEVMGLVREEISSSGLPSRIFTEGIPVKLDDDELDSLIREQERGEMSSFSAKIAKHAPALKRLAEDLRKLDEYMLCLDLVAGISDMKRDLCLSMPAFGEELSISSSKNLFLASPQPISFSLGSDARCSILTGANSGGKTTLLEHIIQLVSMAQMGLPVSGTSKLPVFSEIYYFAKSKGSAGKGAFETLLSTLSKISPGGSTLILADEIEAVTEPGVAGRIICATCSYYIEKGCFMVIATHLGHDIIRELPERARVDGIEAKGLDENNELIVDHNPVLGRLANSTPELIIERLAKTGKSEYYRFIHTYLSR